MGMGGHYHRRCLVTPPGLRAALQLGYLRGEYGVLFLPDGDSTIVRRGLKASKKVPQPPWEGETRCGVRRRD